MKLLCKDHSSLYSQWHCVRVQYIQLITRCVIIFLTFGHSDWWEMVYECNFNLFYLVINEKELFMCLRNSSLFPFWYVFSAYLLSILLLGFNLLFALIFMSYLNIENISPFICDKCYKYSLSHFNCLLTLFMVFLSPCNVLCNQIY